MGIVGALLEAAGGRWAQWKSALEEAARRDEEAAEELRRKGYRFRNGCWHTPEGNTMFDGPWSHVSLLAQLEAVATERGLRKDLESLERFVRKWRASKRDPKGK